MIKFHSIQRKVEKTDPMSKVVLEMDYDDVANLSHLLWECRKKGMLEKEEHSILQLEMENLRHLLADGRAMDPFVVNCISERLKEIGEKETVEYFDEVHDLTKNPQDLPNPNVKVQVEYKHNGFISNSLTIYDGKKWEAPYGIAPKGEEFEILAWKEFKCIELEKEIEKESPLINSRLASYIKRGTYE